jgi:hypothetical protein
LCNVLGFGVWLLCFLPYYIIGVVTERNGVERGHRGRFAFGGSATFKGSGDRHFVAPLTSFAPLLSRNINLTLMVSFNLDGFLFTNLYV